MQPRNTCVRCTDFNFAKFQMKRNFQVALESVTNDKRVGIFYISILVEVFVQLLLC